MGRPLNYPVPEVKTLLDKYLPHIHPSALKHEYLTSVVNAFIHREAQSEPSSDGAFKCIGFADYRRTLPLVLIVDKSAQGGVRISHAFIPNMNIAIDRKLVAALQRHEHNWARQHGLTAGRNIAQYLRDNNSRRDQINKRGLPEYMRSVFTDEDLKDAHENWYETDFIHDDLTINTRDGEMVHIGYDLDVRDIIEENIKASVDMSLDKDTIRRVDGVSRWPDDPSPEAERNIKHGPHIKSFSLDEKSARHNILRRGRIYIEFDTPSSDGTGPDFEL